MRSFICTLAFVALMAFPSMSFAANKVPFQVKNQYGVEMEGYLSTSTSLNFGDGNGDGIEGDRDQRDGSGQSTQAYTRKGFSQENPNLFGDYNGLGGGIWYTNQASGSISLYFHRVRSYATCYRGPVSDIYSVTLNIAPDQNQVVALVDELIQPVAPALDTFEQDALYHLNLYRQRTGLIPLSSDDYLNTAADSHSYWLDRSSGLEATISGGSESHCGISNSSPTDRALATAYPRESLYGDDFSETAILGNAAWFQTMTGEKAVEMFRTSSAHWNILMGSGYSCVGIGTSSRGIIIVVGAPHDDGGCSSMYTGTDSYDACIDDPGYQLSGSECAGAVPPPDNQDEPGVANTFSKKATSLTASSKGLIVKRLANGYANYRITVKGQLREKFGARAVVGRTVRVYRKVGSKNLLICTAKTKSMGAYACAKTVRIKRTAIAKNYKTVLVSYSGDGSYGGSSRLVKTK